MTSHQDGFTLVELLVVLAITGVLSAIALPALTSSRIAANEASGIASLRNVHSGQIAFAASCGRGAYSPSLQNLGLSVGMSPGYVSSDIAGPAPVVKSGYALAVSGAAVVPGVSCNGGGMLSAYHATAVPQPHRGVRYFGVNTSGTVFQSPQTLVGVMPDVGAPPAPATPLQR